VSEQEFDILMWFEGTAKIRATDERAAHRWKMIADVLRSLGCVDVHLREVERKPVPAALAAEPR
jgi:hypothetical protein